MFKDFESYLTTEKRFSDHTVLAYVNDLNQFIEFSEIKSRKDIVEVNSKLIRGWIVKLYDDKVSKKSINRKLSSLRTFFKWLIKNGEIGHNPLNKVTGVKSEKKLPSFAKVAEMSTEGLDSFFSSDFEGQRNKLIVEIFYQTGIRLSELIELKDQDVSSDSIKVIGKRNKERKIPISSKLLSLISEYKTLKNSSIGKDDKLFVLKNGNKMYPKLVYRIINNYLGYVTNLDKCSPHVLRHTFATHMLNNGAGLETLKEILGHANLSATQVYTHNSFTQLTNIYSQAHPRGHKKK